MTFKKLPAPKKKADDVRLFAEGMQLDPSRDLSIGLPGVCRIVISYGEIGYRLELFPAAEGKKRRFAGGLGWEDVGMYLKGVLLEGKSAEDLPGKKREPSRKKTPAGEAPAMDRFEILTAIRTRPEDYLPLVDHARKFFESRSEWGEVNIGWNVGLLEGNRPWFAECWAEDGITVLTYYLSTAGIENKNRRQLIAVLEKAGIVKFADPQGRRYTEVIKHTDGKGDEFFAVNVVAGTEDASFLTADSGLVFGFDELNRYNAPQKD